MVCLNQASLTEVVEEITEVAEVAEEITEEGVVDFEVEEGVEDFEVEGEDMEEVRRHQEEIHSQEIREIQDHQDMRKDSLNSVADPGHPFQGRSASHEIDMPHPHPDIPLQEAGHQRLILGVQ